MVSHTDNDFIFNARHGVPNRFDPEVVLGRMDDKDDAQTKPRMFTRLIRLQPEVGSSK